MKATDIEYYTTCPVCGRARSSDSDRPTRSEASTMWIFAVIAFLLSMGLGLNVWLSAAIWLLTMLAVAVALRCARRAAR